jgi:hypothetical protein
MAISRQNLVELSCSVPKRIKKIRDNCLFTNQCFPSFPQSSWERCQDDPASLFGVGRRKKASPRSSAAGTRNKITQIKVESKNHSKDGCENRWGVSPCDRGGTPIDDPSQFSGVCFKRLRRPRKNTVDENDAGTIPIKKRGFHISMEASLI